jgi:alanyl-tRNA synthetase
MRIVSRIFDDRDLEEIKLLAHRLVASDSVVALLAARDQETVRLVFARSADVEIDVSLLLRQACAALDGRGGGKPDFAQGGGSRVAALERALAEVKAELANGK